MVDINENLKIAIVSSIKAGKEILKVYNSDDIELKSKSDNSPLTKADINSNNKIIEILSKTKIPILSEEGHTIDYEIRKKWDRLWIIDPLDGTKEFVKRNGEFTVNIALIEKQKPILGVIFVPVSGDLYFSAKDIGSFKIKINIEKFNINVIISKAIKLPFTRKNKAFTIVASRSHMSSETEAFVQQMRKKYGEVELISKGSSLKLCMVAEGSADSYPRFAPTMEWDTAAGQAICEHAGFNVIDWQTKKPMLYNREELLNNWFLVK